MTKEQPEAEFEAARRAPAEVWYCEDHPEHPMGHDGCEGAGVLECARIPLLANQLRLSMQAEREANAYAGDIAANARARISELEGLAAAPQPPEDLMSEIRTTKPDQQGPVSNATFDAPVELPEPAGWIDDDGLTFWLGPTPNDGENLYTEQQVRALLSNQPPKVVSDHESELEKAIETIYGLLQKYNEYYAVDINALRKVQDLTYSLIKAKGN